ncbi:MAG: TlpA disulfide reductase family protein [Bacteroidota bacterium]|nr:TlpA disulfide reductase family protein [Bacteroidota bacterium]
MKFKYIILFFFLIWSFISNAQNIQIITQDSLIKLVNNKPDSGVIIVNFWATWCKPCVEELPYFKKIDSMLKADNYQFIFVSLDKTTQIKIVNKFIDNQKIPGIHHLVKISNVNQMIDEVDKNWGGSIPLTIVLTKDDRKIHEGSFDSFKDLWSFIRED